MAWTTVSKNAMNKPAWARGRSVINPGEFTGLAQQLTAGSSGIASSINNMTQTGNPFQTRDHFLNLLSQWETYLPLNELWMVFFDIPSLVREQELRRWGEYHMAQSWGIDEVKEGRFRVYYEVPGMFFSSNG